MESLLFLCLLQVSYTAWSIIVFVFSSTPPPSLMLHYLTFSLSHVFLIWWLLCLSFLNLLRKWSVMLIGSYILGEYCPRGMEFYLLVSSVSYSDHNVVPRIIMHVSSVKQRRAYLSQDKSWGYRSDIWRVGHSRICLRFQAQGCHTLSWPAELLPHSFGSSLQTDPTFPTSHPPELENKFSVTQMCQNNKVTG